MFLVGEHFSLNKELNDLWGQFGTPCPHGMGETLCTLARLCNGQLRIASVMQGYGTLLMEEAERIAVKEHRSKKLAVISGVGTRHYYRKLGYELEGPYMVKNLL